MQAITLEPAQNENKAAYQADHCSCYARCFRHPEIDTAVIHNVTSRGGSLPDTRLRTNLIEKRFDRSIREY
ncbi:hypothetical protein GCM10025794_27220 [Massilia kyonggiensis]|jgi:hypothetical protein